MIARKTNGERTTENMACMNEKVEKMTVELARLTDLVKGMERGGRMLARKTNGERTTENMPCMKETVETVEKVTVEKEGGQGDRR